MIANLSARGAERPTGIQQLNSENGEISEQSCHENTKLTPTPQRIFLWTQLLVALAVSMAMMLNGFAFGYTSNAIPSMLNSTWEVYSSDKIVTVGSSIPLAAIVGSLLGGPLITYVGRRYSIMGAGVPFFIGWILIASATNSSMLLTGQVLCGVCTGVLSTALLVYIVETIQPEVRGALGLLPLAFRYSGIFLARHAEAYLDWSEMAYIGAALSIIYFLLMLSTPESPRWYIAKGRTQNARKALQWLRGKNYNVENEIEELTQFQIEADKTKGIALQHIFSIKYIPAVFISLSLIVLQQLSGSHYVFYTLTTTRISGVTADVQLFAIIIEVLSVISIFVAVVLIERIGRKTLLYISSASMIFSIVTLGVFVYIQRFNDNLSVEWFPQACCALYVFGLSMGFGSIPFLMLGEILPLKIRDTAASLIIGVDWACTFYVTNSLYYNRISYTVIGGALLMFIIIQVVAILFVIFCVPETRSKSLEEIELNLTQRLKDNRQAVDANAEGI
ncbi:hypothetical protein K1T71_010587 [Dendrolimus kikuchii]|uniref:Uncharacterized protein n=1 Tax=Dendrolimus kikuchii TaxID=765133 RepID=A0ACC1CPD2_9NEOP|nr:hypothetical protein K1T71_010587 [Dendrolimus kikuchii]